MKNKKWIPSGIRTPCQFSHEVCTQGNCNLSHRCMKTFEDREKRRMFVSKLSFISFALSFGWCNGFKDRVQMQKNILFTNQSHVFWEDSRTWESESRTRNLLEKHPDDQNDSDFDNLTKHTNSMTMKILGQCETSSLRHRHLNEAFRRNPIYKVSKSWCLEWMSYENKGRNQWSSSTSASHVNVSWSVYLSKIRKLVNSENFL